MGICFLTGIGFVLQEEDLKTGCTAMWIHLNTIKLYIKVVDGKFYIMWILPHLKAELEKNFERSNYCYL